jgi:predicted ArsR family transcriptional regulator
VRQEVVSELGESGGTVKELAARLGRSRQALHFHIGVLEKVGLVEVAGERGEGRERERVYRVVPGSADMRAKRLNRGERAAAAAATRAMLRMTQREVARAIAEERIGPGLPAMAMRAKARLDAAGLARLKELTTEMAALFRTAKGKNAGERMFALTLVLTPARETRARSAAGGRGEKGP